VPPTTDRARKAAARARQAATGEPYAVAARRVDEKHQDHTAETRVEGTADSHPLYAYMPYPAPTVTGAVCPECDGEGVSGELYAMPGDAGPAPLLVDVLCARCLGCGADACPELAVGEVEVWDMWGEAVEIPADAWEDDEPDEDEEEAREEEAEHLPDLRCRSCDGRGWYPLQGWPSDPDDGEAVTVLRVPCGCMEAFVTLISADQDAAA